ncbi:MAG TPA: matrixin family metalloprotease [Candidatus Krumholzibacteria bacterium]
MVESFKPTTRTLNTFVGDTLRFSIDASDPDRDNLVTSYYVNEEWVAEGDDWDYPIVDTGLVAVRARVTDGRHTSYIDWRVKSEIPINAPPVIGTTLPFETNPRLVIGNFMDFAVIAEDPERLPLTYTFSVNDSLVKKDRTFRYLASSVGNKLVRAVVSDGEKSAVHEWHLRVTTFPDAIPPAGVMITLAETGVEPGEVNIEWTAVGRDGMVGLPSLYQVRTSPFPILTETDWARSSDRPNVPEPATAGETMRMVVGGLLPARPTYVAVRAVDDFANISAIQPPVEVVTRGMRFGGRVIDTVTWQGIPNAIVSFGNETRVTDQDGVYEFIEQGYADGEIMVRDEDDDAVVGAYYNYTLTYSVKHEDVVNLYLIPNRTLNTADYPDLLTFFRAMTDQGTIPYPSDQRRRALPIALYVRPYEKNNLDYAAAIRSVAAEFDEILGGQVFLPVNDATIAARVETTYNGIISRDRYTQLTWSDDWYPLAGLIEFRVLYSAETVEAFKQIVRHEFGHSLGLNHSNDSGHLMVGFQAARVPTFTNDEVAVLRTFYAIPRGWNVRRFQRN